MRGLFTDDWFEPGPFDVTWYLPTGERGPFLAATADCGVSSLSVGLVSVDLSPASPHMSIPGPSNRRRVTKWLRQLKTLWLLPSRRSAIVCAP